MKISKLLLTLGGLLSFAIAIFQIVITFSPEWAHFFGLSENVTSDMKNLSATGVVTAITFAMFGIYGMSGAGLIPPMPILRSGLLGIGIAYVIRGLVVVPVLLIEAGYLQIPGDLPANELSTSLVSLFVGVVYLAGVWVGWQELKAAVEKAAEKNAQQ